MIANDLLTIAEDLPADMLDHPTLALGRPWRLRVSSLLHRRGGRVQILHRSRPVGGER